MALWFSGIVFSHYLTGGMVIRSVIHLSSELAFIEDNQGQPVHSYKPMDQGIIKNLVGRDCNLHAGQGNIPRFHSTPMIDVIVTGK
ncbi:hypothetical protein NYO67_7772 [Aspergillus flavus]|nr:hypothetical protein NYO67_7772 [Aspergillus flavus]